MLLIVELLFIVLLSMILFMLYRNERIFSRKAIPQATIEEYWPGKERRQCVRFKKDLEVSYTIEKKTHLRNNGKTVDLSESGMKLLLGEKLSKGTVLDLQIMLTNPRKIIEAEGEVVWSEEALAGKDHLGKRLFHTGLKFLGVKSAAGETLSDCIRLVCVDFED